MELDLQSLLGSMCTAVLFGWDPASPSLPPHLGSYTRALLVNQDRRHLIVTPWLILSNRLTHSHTHTHTRYCTLIQGSGGNFALNLVAWWGGKLNRPPPQGGRVLIASWSTYKIRWPSAIASITFNMYLGWLKKHKKIISWYICS